MKQLPLVFAWMDRTILSGLAILSALLPVGLFGQDTLETQSVAADSVTVIPGPRYEKGWLLGLMTGRGYRNLWSEPLTVEVAELSKLGGGIAPIRIGGGMTTKTLHVRGADGKRYVFRSVDKDPAQGMPEIRGTPIHSLLQDQISAFHPSGALVVAPLLKAVDVLHPEPRYMVLPDDPRLGRFREQFAGMLVLFEERPNEGPEGSAGFAGSSMILGSDTLLMLLDQDPRHGVDARDFLRARLVDLYVGDRDRTGNNWRWAGFDEGERYIWRPIPRDRDQAFIRFDGVLKWIFRFFEPRLVAFGEDYSSIVGLTRSAWDLDRRFLVGLDKSSWDLVVTELQGQLTDSVINAAVRQLPPEHYRIGGAALARKLKLRRDRLSEAADRFYELIFQYADIQATNRSELVEVDRLDADHVEVRLYHRGENGVETQPTLFFRRTFDRRETREIRLYLYGGADQAVVRGIVQRSIKVRIAGGDGADELIDSSRVRGRHTYFYDAGANTRFVRGPATAVVRRRAPRPVLWQDEAVTPDWGHTWKPSPQLRFDGGFGLFIVPAATRYRYGFLKRPYSSRIQLSAGYATGANRFVLDYRQDFRDIVQHVHAQFHGRWSGIEILHFYGFGNETEELESRSFYKVNQTQLVLEPSGSVSAGGVLEFGMSPVLKVSSTDTTRGTRSFLAEARPYGSGSFSQLGVQAALHLDTRDRPVAATEGFFLSGGASYYPAILDVDRGSFGQIHGEVSTYVTPAKGADQTLALRVGGKKVWGTAPFYEAAFVGGAKTLRGFREQRFAGHASLYANLEVRVFLGMFGFFGLTDAGRIFERGVSSDKWHLAAGGGILIAPLKRSNTFSLAVARGAEHTAFYIGTGFLF